jgi:hypothetical protein
MKLHKIILLLAFILIADISYSYNFDINVNDTNEVVYFDFNRYDLKPEAYPILERVLKVFAEYPDATLEVIGHADAIGSYDYNLKLSERRANTVAEYLISKGMKRSNITSKGMGKSDSVATNLTDEGRARNRRVEFKWHNTSNQEFLPGVNAIGDIKDNQWTGFISNLDTSGAAVEISPESIQSELQWGNNKITNTNLKLIPFNPKLQFIISILMDYSGSMFINNDVPGISLMENAVKSFINSMNDNTYIRIIKFGSSIDVIQNYTNNKTLLLKAVNNNSQYRDKTSMLKAVLHATNINEYKNDPLVVKYIIVCSDGEDNNSDFISVKDIISVARENLIRVYCIGLMDFDKHSYPPGLNSKAENDLFELADETGGYYFYNQDSTTLSKYYEIIQNQIYKSYNISIEWDKEKLPPKGTTVTLVITVNTKGTIKTFRKSYIMQ